MVIKRINTKGLEVDAVGLLLTAITAVLGYVLFLHNPFMALLERDQTVQRQRELEQAVSRLHTEFAREKQAMLEAEKKLGEASVGLEPVEDVDDVLARLDRMGSECDVNITRWQPLGVETWPEYESRLFVVEGVAGFPALHRWFALIESGVPLLDITHLRINAAGGDPTAAALSFECTLKLHADRRVEDNSLAMVLP